VNFCEKDAPWFSGEELKELEAIWCVTESLFVQTTVAPTAMLISAGLKAKPWMFTWELAGIGAGVETGAGGGTGVGFSLAAGAGVVTGVGVTGSGFAGVGVTTGGWVTVKELAGAGATGVLLAGVEQLAAISIVEAITRQKAIFLFIKLWVNELCAQYHYSTELTLGITNDKIRQG